MVQKAADYFWRIAGLKTFLAALGAWIIFGLVVMPASTAKLQQITGKKLEVLDLQFSYTPERARAIIAEYGETGRYYAAWFEAIADTIYPMVYTSLFLIIISWVFRSLSVYGVRIRYIHMLPFLVMLADYCENACVITMLKTFPDFSDGLAMMSSVFTSLKWSLIGAQAFVIGGAIWLLTFYKMTRGKFAGK